LVVYIIKGTVQFNAPRGWPLLAVHRSTVLLHVSSSRNYSTPCRTSWRNQSVDVSPISQPNKNDDRNNIALHIIRKKLYFQKYIFLYNFKKVGLVPSYLLKERKRVSWVFDVSCVLILRLFWLSDSD
jgi:hypothetical protein